MLKIKFTSTFSETDFKGNTKTQINSFEASGSEKEVSKFTFNLIRQVQLPGVKPLLISDRKNLLLEMEDPEDTLFLPPYKR